MSDILTKLLERYWKEECNGSNPAMVDFFDLRDWLTKEIFEFRKKQFPNFELEKSKIKVVK